MKPYRWFEYRPQEAWEKEADSKISSEGDNLKVCLFAIAGVASFLALIASILWVFRLLLRL
jgi:hypothetical protein